MWGGLSTAAGSGVLVRMAIEAPESPVLPGGVSACTSPTPVHLSKSFHCYTPADIAGAYGVDKLHTAGLLGQGQTIVLVDSYGDPTAGADLKFFPDTRLRTPPHPTFAPITAPGRPG